MRGPIRGVALIIALSVGAASSHPHAHTVQSATPKYITIIASAGALGPMTNSEPSGFVAPVIHAPKTLTPHVAKVKAVVKSPIVAHRTAHAFVTRDSYTIGESLWQTWRYDPTAYQPTADDPTRALPMAAQVTFACIRYVESRNHPNDTNQYSGAEGLYQFLPYIWQYGAKEIGLSIMDANYATPQEQSAVAVWYWKHNGGFAPEWEDGCTG